MRKRAVIGVYKITIDKYYYIGASVNVEERFSAHRTELKNNKHHNKILQAVFNRYGESSLKVEVLEETETVVEAFEIEKRLVTVDTIKEDLCANHIPGGTLGVYGLLGEERKATTLKSTLNKKTIRCFMVIDRNENVVGKFIGGESVSRALPISAGSCYDMSINQSRRLASGPCQGYTIIRILRDNECVFIETSIKNKLENDDWSSNIIHYKVTDRESQREEGFAGASSVCERFNISVPTLLQLIKEQKSTYKNTKRNRLLEKYKFEKL